MTRRHNLGGITPLLTWGRRGSKSDGEMKVLLVATAVAVLVVGCSPHDPIDRFVAKISDPQIGSHLYQPIELPEDATPQECISVIASRDRRELLCPKILKIRKMHISDSTVILLDTDAGQKIVLLRSVFLKVGMHQWEYWIYDAK